jgi:hypothetical protein
VRERSLSLVSSLTPSVIDRGMFEPRLQVAQD